MKRKLSFKIILMIIIFFTTLIVFTTYSNAIDAIIEDADSFLGKGTDETLDFGQIKTVSDSLYNLFFIIGVIVTVLVGMVIGIKFMTESAEEKAKIKEALVPYIIGCVIIYGAFGIWKISINIGKNLAESDSTKEVYSEISQGIIDETMDVTSLSEDDLKGLFNYNQISGNITTILGNNRAQTVEEAVSMLSEYQKQIYNECKRRGLLNESGTNLKTD